MERTIDSREKRLVAVIGISRIAGTGARSTMLELSNALADQPEALPLPRVLLVLAAA